MSVKAAYFTSTKTQRSFCVEHPQLNIREADINEIHAFALAFSTPVVLL